MNKSIEGKVSILTLFATIVASVFLLGRTITSVSADHDPFNGVPQTSVDICHVNGDGGYVSNSPNISGSGGNLNLQGHAGHISDIIPPFHWQGCSDDDADYTSTDSTKACKTKIGPDWKYDDLHTYSYAGKNWTTDNQDIWENECSTPDEEEPTDVCDNLDGIQEETPDGYINDEGYCYIPEEPIDVCPNIEGNQESLPDGYHYDDQENCVPDERESTPSPSPTPNPDVCLNIDGIQTSVPDGLHLGADGTSCVAFSQPGVDNPSGGAPQGQVLGASTMAGTGSFLENLYLAIMGIGATLSIKGFKKATKKA